MAVIPAWYRMLLEFSYVFHSIFDLLFILLGLLIVGVVSQPGWRQHLRWATPAAAGSILDGLNRLAQDMHHYLGIGARLNVYITADVFNYPAVLLSCYGLFMLWRTLRDLARHPASPDPLAQYLPPSGVWPPAPTVRHD